MESNKLGKVIVFLAFIMLNLIGILALNVNIPSSTTSTVIISNIYSNSSDLWITDEGIMDNVIDILGSDITNDLGWITTWTETDPIWTANSSLVLGYVNSNYTNKSNFWDDTNTFNSTQMENSGGYLNILVSWLTSLFYTESEIDSKIINNASYFATGNTSYVLKTGDTMTGNLNFSTGVNITNVNQLNMKNIGNNSCVMTNGSFCRNNSGLFYQSGN